MSVRAAVVRAEKASNDPPIFRRNSVVAERSIVAQTATQGFAASFGQSCLCASKEVTAEFSAKQSSEFCTCMDKDRIRDNTSLSALNDAGADHGRRGSRIRRLARGLTSIRPVGRTGPRLRASCCEGVLREAASGRGCPKPREQFRLAPRERMRRLSPSFSCSVGKASLLIGRVS